MEVVGVPSPSTDKLKGYMSSLCPVSGESPLEERANQITHFLGLILSIIGMPILIVWSYLWGDFWHVASFSIYGTTLVLLYVASTYYHGCKHLRLKRRLRIIDHACIYLLIAGSYTPFTLGPLRDTSGLLLLSIEWGIATVGILLKIFAFNRFEKMSLAAYLVMGWLIVFSWPTLAANLSLSAIILLASGGLSYSFGTIFFVWRSLPFNHAIWHVFVLGGSACHFLAVLLLLA